MPLHLNGVLGPPSFWSLLCWELNFGIAFNYFSQNQPLIGLHRRAHISCIVLSFIVYMCQVPNITRTGIIRYTFIYTLPCLDNALHIGECGWTLMNRINIFEDSYYVVSKSAHFQFTQPRLFGESSHYRTETRLIFHFDEMWKLEWKS